MFDHIQKQVFLTLISKEANRRKFVYVHEKPEFRFLQEKYHLCQKEVFRRRVCCHFSLIALIGFIYRH